MIIEKDKYLPISSNIDTILKIVIAWLKKFWSISIIAKKYATPDATTF